jgi:hypothetical protein
VPDDMPSICANNTILPLTNRQFDFENSKIRYMLNGNVILNSSLRGESVGIYLGNDTKQCYIKNCSNIRVHNGCNACTIIDSWNSEFEPGCSGSLFNNVSGHFVNSGEVYATT